MKKKKHNERKDSKQQQNDRYIGFLFFKHLSMRAEDELSSSIVS